MTRWRIYYGDGSTYSDTDGTPYDAPTRNVQAIISADDAVGWHMHNSEDYYWWHTEMGWVSGDHFGFYDYLLEPGPKRVLFGRSISREEYNAIIERAHQDPYLPHKSAYLPNERRL